MFVKPKYVMPKPEGTGFRAKSDSDTCFQFDKADLLGDAGAAASNQPSRPKSAPSNPAWEKLASSVLVFGLGLSDSEDEEVVAAPGTS